MQHAARFVIEARFDRMFKCFNMGLHKTDVMLDVCSRAQTLTVWCDQSASTCACTRTDVMLHAVLHVECGHDFHFD